MHATPPREPSCSLEAQRPLTANGGTLPWSSDGHTAVASASMNHGQGREFLGNGVAYPETGNYNEIESRFHSTLARSAGRDAIQRKGPLVIRKLAISSFAASLYAEHSHLRALLGVGLVLCLGTWLGSNARTYERAERSAAPFVVKNEHPEKPAPNRVSTGRFEERRDTDVALSSIP